MPRYKDNNPAPDWFDLKNYAAAREMDAADWYLNLSLRSYIHREQEIFWMKFVQTQPLLRRADGAPIEFWGAESDFGSNFMAILHGRTARSGVQALSGTEFYAFEKMLPQNVREFGAAFVPGKTRPDGAPKGFDGPLDHLFERRFASAFLRIDLTLPDDVLLEDMRNFLRAKRAELAAIEGVHPYRDALASITKRRDPKPTVWASRKLLAVIDIDQWRESTNSTFTDAEIQRLLCIGENDFRQARDEAAQLLVQFALDGWLLPLARKATPAGAPDFP